MTNNETILLQAIGDGGIITDGDWIESRDQDPTGKIRLIQLADVGDGQFLNKSRKYVNAQTVERLHCTLLVPGDVLVARLPDPLGRACVFPNISQPAIAAVDVCIIRPNPNVLHPEWLASFLNSPKTRASIALEAQGATRARVPTGKLKQLKLQPPPIDSQKHFVERWVKANEFLNRAATSIRFQKTELDKLVSSIVFDSLQCTKVKIHSIRNVLDEVKYGIGENWHNFSVLGATRSGLAPAKERPGKNPERYKPVDAGTVFYNPMRILIGSIAFVDEDDEPGITSPDYVVLKGKPGVVDSRWFYYWLRSPLGERCIQSLARGAVRERMLFNRLAEGEIELPSYDTQVKASKALAQIKPMSAAIQKQITEIELLPQKLLAQFFGL
jgi:type I restriction enzyme S subunit